MKFIIFLMAITFGALAQAETVFTEAHTVGRIGERTFLVELISLTANIDVTDKSGNVIKTSVRLALDCLDSGVRDSETSASCHDAFEKAKLSNRTVSVVYESENIHASKRCLGKDFTNETTNGVVCYSVVPSDVIIGD